MINLSDSVYCGGGVCLVSMFLNGDWGVLKICCLKTTDTYNVCHEKGSDQLFVYTGIDSL